MKQQFTRFLFFCLVYFLGVANAQDILLLYENFEVGGSAFTINSVGPGNNSGDNKWIINNEYNGNINFLNTTSQDNTTGGTINFAPHSNYLHIHNEPANASNANYDATSASDRFAHMANGVCTYAIDEVHFSFFFLCEGSTSAYGNIYYSLDGGPWIQFGLNQYSNTSVWQFVDITDPVFSNVESLRFGFRWQNDNGLLPNSQSFAIDDVFIMGSYSELDPVAIDVLSISPDPACAGGFVTLEYELSDTLCDGDYQIQLSNGNGVFNGSFGSWVFSINYPNTTGFVSIQIPGIASVDDCYKFRINRLSPPPEITGTASTCFEVIECPNLIITLQPAVTLGTNAVCVGSVIDIPFTSTGLFDLTNSYTAQLSNADGTFPENPLVVGSLMDLNTYDPQLGDPPGNVSGLVPVVEPGCNYYLRVVSTNPETIGSNWGPFCIGQCDIALNNGEGIQICVSECAIDPDGENMQIPFDINAWNENTDYLPGNVFNLQLLSSENFTQIGSDGILGSLQSETDDLIDAHFPCKDSLDYYGIVPGVYYLRIAASNSINPENATSSLVQVTIGAFSEAQIITAYTYPQFVEQYVFCVGETVALQFEPYDYFLNSTYRWQCNGINGGQPFVSPSGTNSNSLYVILGGAGTLTFSIEEESFGCISPWTPEMSIEVVGDPIVNIIGPNNIVAGDTATYQVNYYPSTSYLWSVNAPLDVIQYFDTTLNELNIAFSNTGNYTVSVIVSSLCGAGDDQTSVNIISPPWVEGVESSLESSFIYPNPSDESFTLIIPYRLSGGRIVISNGLGQIIYEISGIASEFSLNTNSWPSGVYQIALSYDAQVEVIRWVKK